MLTATEPLTFNKGTEELIQALKEAPTGTIIRSEIQQGNIVTNIMLVEKLIFGSWVILDDGQEDTRSLPATYFDSTALDVESYLGDKVQFIYIP